MTKSSSLARLNINAERISMEIRSIGIIGAGTMGNGIAQVAAGAGFNVILLDINDAALEKGLAALNNSLDRLIKKESITAEQKAQTLARIKTTTHYADLAAVSLVIEAATEAEGGKPVERMIPFVAAFVDGVDLPGKRITVDWQPDY